MGRERVPERVWADPSAESRRPGRGPDDRECLLASEPPAPIAQEQRSAALQRRVAQLEQGRTALVEPGPQPVQRDVTHGNEPLAIALADDPDEAAVEREILRSSPVASLTRRPAAYSSSSRARARRSGAASSSASTTFTV